MDWIEQWFGLNPDGGNGTVEAGLVMAVVLALGIGALARSSTIRHAALRMLRGCRRLWSARPAR